jgi:phosphate transport system protein
MEKAHIVKKYDDELEAIRHDLIQMGLKVEARIGQAMESLVNRDSELARRLIENDHLINEMEVDLDEKSVELIARRQPTAQDLRLIILALKIVTDLERIGDQCVSIAKRVLELNAEPPLDSFFDLTALANRSAEMVHHALNAFLERSEEMALQVCADDQVINAWNSRIQKELIPIMTKDHSFINRAIKLTYISKCLERIADHATNVAEMVVYFLKGEDIRHKLA